MTDHAANLQMIVAIRMQQMSVEESNAILAAADEIERLKSRNEMLVSDNITYRAKLQFLVDNWPQPLEDGGITFPDGDFWPQTTKEKT